MSNKGLLYALGAYLAWGLFPIYWKWLHQIDAVQLIGHRIGWSFIMLMAFIFATGQFKALKEAVIKKSVLVTYSIAAVLIAINWLMYVWAVNANYIVETSLGYFINPLLSVFLGVIFLRERLRIFQWVPVILGSVKV